MKPDDIEKTLKETRFSHINEDWLVLYRDRQLDGVRTAMTDAHLKLCLLCQKRLTSLSEDKAALDSATPNTKDIAFVKQAIQHWGPRPRESDMEITKPPPRPALVDQLAAYIGQLAANWRQQFMVLAVRAPKTTKEIWKWQSGDGAFKARAVMNKDGSLTIELSATELVWQDARLLVRLGRFRQEVVLKRVPTSEVYARLEIPRAQRPRNLGDISIELVR